MSDCKQCGTTLTAKTWSSGRVEDPSMLARRQFCDRQCMADWQMGRIKVMNPKNSRRQSGRTVAVKCERCGVGDTKLHVHHRDHDPTNNAPGNLQTLCVPCHRQSHSPNFDPDTGDRKACAHCRNPAVQRGFCFTHLTRFKRYGHPLAKKRKIGTEWVLMIEPA
jgi:hypothetical protein